MDEYLPPVAPSISKKKKRKVPSTKERHHSNMRRFLDSKEERAKNKQNVYTKDATWSDEFIYALKPEHVVAYMKLRAYGDSKADVETMRPTFCRHKTLQQIKSGISFFHPEKTAEWSVRRGVGNPTRSVVVRELLKKVQQAEVAGNGAKSQERGPFVEEEFEQIIRLFEANVDIEIRIFTSAIFRMQYNMGGRIDDVSKQRIKNIIPNKDISHQDLSIITKLPWSKNVRTKQ